MPALPLFVRLHKRPVILIGAGEAAEAKRRLLERAGAVVVAESEAAALAIVVDDDAAVARLRARGVLVNAVDRPELCDFTLPAIVDRSPVIVAIGTGGASAGLAAALRQRLEAMLPARLGRLADALHAARGAWRARYPGAGERRRAIGAALAAGGALDPLLDHGDAPDAGPSQAGGVAGIVRLRLRSADPDDLTLREARALANADRVTHRPGAPRAILDRARADAARIECAAPPLDAAPGLTVDVEML
ncbi:siroheme synthase [Sphingomonas sp. CL5.1]|uniref:precorrin-2 dehydrogenase/sirohydrochlorin ferrochelatase family protein n=1 Tax=Sphingomonas sp. CL5.1 TaxID=2653203 RepID=UPI001583E4C1|nr:NAD(P)-dependent oxidoreductase [Sphingomonas sp. CL5.1]QKS01965.1 siroheme synthase [Sphingomonas sp. CL5.1]